MSLSFDGVDDSVTSTTSPTFAASVSASAWFNHATQGETNAGVLLRLMGTRFQMLQWNGTASSRKLEFACARSTAGIWEMTTGFTTLGGWKFAAVTYDGSVAGNHPTLYVWDGAVYPSLTTLTFGAGLTRTSTPAGGLTGTGSIRIGSTTGALTTAGLLGELAIWDGKVLTPEEVAAVFVLGAGAVPEFSSYLPFEAATVAQVLGSSGVAFTITGAVAGENPPIRPVGRRG